MKLGAVEYLVRGQDDRDTLARAKRLGCAGVEIPLARRHLRDPAGARLRSLQQARADSRLAIPSLMLGEHNEGGIASADPGVAGAAAEDIRQAIAWASALGAQVILVPFFFGGEIADEDGARRVADTFRALCPLAAAQGVTLCYEGTWPAGRIRALASEIASPAFGCYLDLANPVWQGLDTPTEIRALGRLVRHVHMKDTRVDPGDCRPGLGRVDYAACARALDDIGYDGWVVLETPAGPLELTARDAGFTRSVFPALEAGPAWPRIGAFSYDFGRGELDGLIEGFARYGLTAVQLGSGLLDEALEAPETIPAMRQRLEERGMTVVALAGYRNIVAPDEGARRANLDYLKRCLEAAPLFGTAVVATETGTRHPESDWLPSPDNASAEAWSLLYAALDELLPVAERHGAILALEAYVNNVVQHEGHVLRVLDRYPTDHLQLVLDPFNYLSKDLLPARERISAAFLRRFEHRFVLAHLKDVSAEGAGADTPEFGSGVFPHALYLDFLRAQRPDLAIILEHLPFAHIPAAVRRIHTVSGCGTSRWPIDSTGNSLYDGNT